MRPHYVYLANSSGLKVGITRDTQIPTRWIDQSATQGLLMYRVQTRRQAGMIEAALRAHIPDKTDWRRMLRGEEAPADMIAKREELYSCGAETVAEMRRRFGHGAVELLSESEPRVIGYPVIEYPARMASLDLDKTPEIEGRLLGVKGQYLILDVGVLNVRKFTGYQVSVGIIGE